MRGSVLDHVRGTAVVIDRPDIDTDQIIPATCLKRVERTGYADDLFLAWRQDPLFPLNQPEAAQARVLVAGRNFGCGSSREHAVWALRDFGFQAVISERIADIFRGNAVNSGLVPVEVPGSAVAAMMRAVAEDPGASIDIDLIGRRIRMPAAGVEEELRLTAFVCHRLRHGLDEIDLTLAEADRITRYEQARPGWMVRLDRAEPAG